MKEVRDQGVTHKTTPKKKPISLTVTCEGRTACDWLGDALPSLGRKQLKAVFAKGAVWLDTGNGRRRFRRVGKILAPGQNLHCYYDPGILDNRPLKPVLVKDQTIWSVWFKPKGMFSSGSLFADHCALPRCAELALGRQAYLVHRLDRATSGLMVLAHTKEAARVLTRAFENRQVDKIYQARVAGDFSVQMTGNGKLIDLAVDGKPAQTRIQSAVFYEAEEESLLDIQLLTGRKHQIRQHLAALNFPVIGDRLYGGLQDGRDLQLEAVALAFDCPGSGQRQRFHV